MSKHQISTENLASVIRWFKILKKGPSKVLEKNGYPSRIDQCVIDKFRNLN